MVGEKGLVGGEVLSLEWGESFGEGEVVVGKGVDLITMLRQCWPNV